MKSNLIKNHHLVRVRIVRDKATLHNINTCNKRATIKRIGGGRHINVRTGEIVEETKQVKRGDSLYSLLESNLRLQDLIKENTIDTDHIVLITLTYAEKVCDMDTANEDFKAFIKRLRRDVTEYGDIEYINTINLHADKTSYHIHAILFFNQSTKNVYIPYETLKMAWQKGYPNIGKPKKNQDVYFYLTPHLSNKVTDKNSHMHKNALLQMELPAGKNLYHYSRGIKKPVIFTDTYENVQKLLKENSYIYQHESVYLNPMRTYKGNNLYYCKEYYTKNKRTPI